MSLFNSSSLRPSLLNPVARKPKPTITNTPRATANIVRLTEREPVSANKSGLKPAVVIDMEGDAKVFRKSSKRTAKLSFNQGLRQPKTLCSAFSHREFGVRGQSAAAPTFWICSYG